MNTHQSIEAQVLGPRHRCRDPAAKANGFRPNTDLDWAGEIQTGIDNFGAELEPAVDQDSFEDIHRRRTDE